MPAIAQIKSRIVRIGGTQHTGWLPEGARQPLPTPIRDLVFNFEITDDGGGNFLLLYESSDHSCHGDTWHKTVDNAFEAASEDFGIKREEWHFLPDNPEGCPAGL